MQPPYSRTLHALLREQCARAPERTCLITSQGHFSFADMLARSNCAAGALYAAGVRRGDRVGLLLPNCVEWLEIAFGTAALGATLVPISTWSTAREIAFLMDDAGVDLMFTCGPFGERDFRVVLADALAATDGHVPTAVVVVDPGDGGSHATRAGSEAVDASAAAPRWREWPDLLEAGAAHAAIVDAPPGSGASAMDDLCLLYTSGSSAHPKSVPLTHARAIENGFNIGERQGLTANDRVFVPVPLFWSYGAVNALPATLSHGATMVAQRQFAAAEALAMIEQHACTAIYTLPAITNALLSEPGFSPERTATLRTGVTIGAPQDVRRAAEMLGAGEICNIYGSTETYGNCCVTWHDRPLAERMRCQGPPLPGVTVRIRDPESGRLCAAGGVGDVEVRGYLTAGYAGRSAAANASVFTDDGFFRTGDLAALDEAGMLVYAGRSSEMIKRSGINVSPAEIEEVLQELPDVGLAGVTGAPDERRGERIVAYVVLRPGATVATDALLQHCRERLSAYKIPDRLELRDSLPLTPTGKLLRKQLRAMASQP